MGIFSTIKAKIFGTKEAPIFKPFRSKADADIAAVGQAQRRRRELEDRVESGASAKVYPNRKVIHSEASGVHTDGSSAGPLGSSPFVENFLDGFPLGQFASSNVWAVTYDRTKSHLYVQYMGGKGRKRSGPGRWYQYRQVSVSEAKSIYNAASKGIFIWDNIRKRGSKNGHKKPYTKDAPPPDYLPLGRKRGNVLQQP